MRYWQKIFITTFILFVVVLYIGVYMVATMTYETALQTEREKCFIEHRNIVLQLKNALSRWGNTQYDATESIYAEFFGFYNARGITLVLRKGDDEFVSMGPEPSALETLNTKGPGLFATVFSLGNEKVIAVESVLTNNAYHLITIHRAEEFFTSHESLKMKLLGGAMIYSLVLTIALYLILPRLNLPLENMANTAKGIAAGNYEARIPVKGYGELKELAESFNQMAIRVNTQIRTLEKETYNKQRFIDNLAHEMRTPLTSINGYAQYLEMAELSEEEKTEALSFIQAQAMRLLDISEKLLVLAKLQDLPLQKSDVQIKKLFLSISKAAAIHNPNVAINLMIDEELTWYTEETLLYMLCGNIINNAINACGDDGEIQISAGKTYLTIIDNGCGIDKKDLPYIFEPFFRVDRSRSAKGGSNGLGLEICRKIAIYLNMKINVSSEVDKGTKVTIIRLHTADGF